ncbi:MAG: hypothetical protein ACTTI3_02700 [Treponema sp.]
MMKRALSVLSICVLCWCAARVSAYAEHGTEKLQKKRFMFAPSLGVSAVAVGLPPDQHDLLGPSLSCDMQIAWPGSGFTLFFHTNTAAWFFLPDSRIKGESGLAFPPPLCLHGMLGYTHAFTDNLSLSGGIGAGIALSPMNCFIPLTPIPGLSAELAVTGSVSEKVGLYCSLLNSVVLIPFGVRRRPDGSLEHGYLFADMCNISVGPCFSW